MSAVLVPHWRMILKLELPRFDVQKNSMKKAASIEDVDKFDFVLEPLVKLDTRGGIFSQSDVEAAIRKVHDNPLVRQDVLSYLKKAEVTEDSMVQDIAFEFAARFFHRLVTLEDSSSDAFIDHCLTHECLMHFSFRTIRKIRTKTLLARSLKTPSTKTTQSLLSRCRFH